MSHPAQGTGEHTLLHVNVCIACQNKSGDGKVQVRSMVFGHS